jgi:hypothetical protein
MKDCSAERVAGSIAQGDTPTKMKLGTSPRNVTVGLPCWAFAPGVAGSAAVLRQARGRGDIRHGLLLLGWLASTGSD